ncbi:hypothetical protein [Streptomyces sp. OK228]|uniref:hypothetical protein n=1 Tax=Streptomyces sp. OK228 TaxID=1882786 RepID=UPI000BC7209B|nr:hypothetical protein [Streptomyces sp. OK228]SOE25645.1 hypothetical protein SAMN05442782_2388 [Streptomyces sp. OK228]
MKEFFTAAFWRSVWWYMGHPEAPSGYSPGQSPEPDFVDAYTNPAIIGSDPPFAAPCSHSGIGVSTWFDRSVCPEPCGSMHDRCTRCGRAVGGCPIEGADDYEATTGHAITCGAGFGAPCECDDRPEPGEGSPGDIGLGPLPSFSEPPTGPPFHYGDNGDGITGKHTGRVEDCPGPGCGPRDCEASATTADMTFGPCIKRERHKGWHEDANGAQWTERCRGCGHTEGEGCDCPPDGTVSVPREALRGLVRVAEYVAGSEPYPDPVAARRALGALDDAGLLEQFREDGSDAR